MQRAKCKIRLLIYTCGCRNGSFATRVKMNLYDRAPYVNVMTTTTEKSTLIEEPRGPLMDFIHLGRIL